VQTQWNSQIENLRAQNRYEGRQLVSSYFRSFDLQAENLAVVTVRETWEDRLYEGMEPEPDHSPIAHRGPYTLDVTYTLEKSEAIWRVIHAVYANEPPDWQTP